jgi:hypothetical protein
MKKKQKVAIVKNHLLEEESKRMTKRNIMKPKVDTDTVSAFSSHKNYHQTRRKMNAHLHFSIIVE